MLQLQFNDSNDITKAWYWPYGQLSNKFYILVSIALFLVYCVIEAFLISRAIIRQIICRQYPWAVPRYYCHDGSKITLFPWLLEYKKQFFLPFLPESDNCKLLELYKLFFLPTTTTAAETDQFTSIATEVQWYYQHMIWRINPLRWVDWALFLIFKCLQFHVCLWQTWARNQVRGIVLKEMSFSHLMLTFIYHWAASSIAFLKKCGYIF